MRFETFKGKDGEFRWRLREDSGRIVSIKPGKIKGLQASPAKKKVSERVVSFSLKHEGANGRTTELRSTRANKPKTAKA